MGITEALLYRWRKKHMSNGNYLSQRRGGQYTSKAFMELLRQYGVRQSFSRVGTPGDNAWSESFFGILKKECVRLQWKMPGEKV